MAWEARSGLKQHDEQWHCLREAKAKWPGKPVRGSEVFCELNCLLDYSIWRYARYASDTVLSDSGETSFCLHVSSCPLCCWHVTPLGLTKKVVSSENRQPEEPWPPGGRVGCLLLTHPPA